MTNDKIKWASFPLSLFILAATAVPSAHSAAQGVAAATIVISAEEHKDAPKKPAAKVAPRRVAPHVVAPRKPAPSIVKRHVVAPKRVAPKIAAPPHLNRKVVTPNNVAPKIIKPQAGKAFTPRGPNAHVVTTSRLRGLPASGAGRASIRGRNYSVWRSGYRIRHGGGWRTFIALSALTTIVIGADEFYPYAYIAAPEAYCDGLTSDGCQLVWEDVATDEGDVIPQCVAYCPWQ